jgi:rubrerythrin
LLNKETFMAIGFTSDEILRIAEEIERNGARYYRRAAENAPDEGNRRMLLDFASMEGAHERIFAAMRGELGPEERGPQTFDPGGEIASYLRSFADSEVFDVHADPASKLSGKESPRVILQTAPGMEKDSIVFYLGIKEMILGVRGKERVEAIIRQEMAHVALLSGKIASLGT